MAKVKITIEVDSEEYRKIREKYNQEKITSHLKSCLKVLAEGELTGPGVLLECPGCEHEWFYKGVEWKTRCNRCGTKIHTGIRPYKNPETHLIEWRLQE